MFIEIKKSCSFFFRISLLFSSQGFSRIVFILDQYRFYTGGGNNDDEAFP